MQREIDRQHRRPRRFPAAARAWRRSTRFSMMSPGSVEPGAREHRVDVGPHPALGRMQDPRHAGERRASIVLRPRQRVAGARHEAQRLVAQRLGVEFGALRVGGQLPDRDVERALPQRGGEHVARVDQHEHLEARAALAGPIAARARRGPEPRRSPSRCAACPWRRRRAPRSRRAPPTGR